MTIAYNNFQTAIKNDFDVDIKMNEIFKGYVDIDENIQAFKMTRCRANTYVQNQNFETRKTKSGKTVWTYWLAPTDKYDPKGHDKLYAIYETINDTPQVFCQGIFKFHKTDKNGRHIFIRVKK